MLTRLLFTAGRRYTRRTACVPRRRDTAFDVDVPTSALEAARAAFDRRDVTASLATAVESVQLPGMPRRHGQPLHFVSDHLNVTIDVQDSDGGLALSVQLGPVGRATVCARHGGADIVQDSDSFGRCRLSPVQPGPVSLLIAHGLARTATPWTNLRTTL